MRLVGLVLLASAAFAQGAGSLSGIVSDDDGAAVPRVKMQAKNSATGAAYSAEGGANGSYKLAPLPAGTYELTADASGFAPFKQIVKLGADQMLGIDIRLHFDVQQNTLGDNPGALFDNLISRQPAPTGPAPRMQDGKPDLSGVWLPSFPTDPGKPEPLPWAATLIKKRTEDSGKDIPSGHCLPLGVIMSTFLFPYKLVQTPKLLVILYEGEFPRQIFLDGRAHPKDPNPSWLGHSIGHWENDTLVVDSVGFNGKAWVGFTGQPATEMLHIVERYRRPDLGHLAIEITVDDPGAYVKPWTIKKVSVLAPNYELMEFICNEGERDLQHLAK
jgi:Carboxypeptidase regulatory-like domain